jgi:hypothetical protein
MTTPEINYCAMKKTGNFFPQFRIIEDFKHNFPGNLSIDCPMKPKKMYLNITEFMGDGNQYKNPVDLAKDPGNGFGVHLPNGKYRFTLGFGTKADPNAFFFQWILELNIRLHDDNF